MGGTSDASIAEKLLQLKRDAQQRIEDRGKRHREHMMEAWAKQGEAQQAREQQQQTERPHKREHHQQERPLSTGVYSFTWSCRLSTFSRLPLPWEAMH